MSILTVENLRKVYSTRFGGNQVEALKNVNFSVDEGEYVAIMGESGSGKTTLLNLLAALDKPTGGTIVLDGKELGRIKESDVATFRRDNLGFVFICAAVLIIYYKQLSEGYEDAQRFEIMQKVGMTKQEIRRSINSQLLTVFFLPLIFAGLHLAFAFPFIRKILYMFSFYNTSFLVWTTVISFFVFAVLYALVYKKTSNTYYKIVS